ncbi:PREDICTED: serpin-Z4-like [Nicotiana attenuata]|uniref:serpin-Z4-like n=1 Tax=Nicotiana attenuata TaxID=49451 RepID=UPI0009052688|nr:PREDICTED: serpin-Z4-like [Nicotiana attenuata]
MGDAELVETAAANVGEASAPSVATAGGSTSLVAEGGRDAVEDEYESKSDLDPDDVCTWEDNFDEYRTINKDFHQLNGDKFSVPFMTGCGKFLYGSYEDEKDGLPSLLTKVNSNPKFFTQKFRLWKEKLDAFYIPKLKFPYTAMDEVIETMKEMGLTLPFDEEFREITEIVEAKGSFFINRILQKAFVEINEKGTEAAAVTFESYDDLGFSLEDLSFVANHPFLFMIREKVSRSVIFTGAVLNPLSDTIT